MARHQTGEVCAYVLSLKSYDRITTNFLSMEVVLYCGVYLVLPIFPPTLYLSEPGLPGELPLFFYSEDNFHAP